MNEILAHIPDESFVPVALACGHVLQGPGHFEVGGEEPNRVECPEGCGWQQFVIEWDAVDEEPSA